MEAHGLLHFPPIRPVAPCAQGNAQAQSVIASGSSERFLEACLPRGLPNTPERARTPNLRFRRPMLYPFELQAQHFLSSGTIAACERRCQGPAGKIEKRPGRPRAAGPAGRSPGPFSGQKKTLRPPAHRKFCCDKAFTQGPKKSIPDLQKSRYA